MVSVGDAPAEPQAYSVDKGVMVDLSNAEVEEAEVGKLEV
jgi:hypothetical protein